MLLTELGLEPTLYDNRQLYFLKELIARCRFALETAPADNQDILTFIEWLTAFSSEANPTSPGDVGYHPSILLSLESARLLADNLPAIDDHGFYLEVDNLLMLLRGLHGSGQLPKQLQGSASIINGELRQFCTAFEQKLRGDLGLGS